MDPSNVPQLKWELTSLGSFSHTHPCSECEGFLGHISSCYASDEPGLRPLIRSVTSAPQRVVVLEHQLALANFQLNAAVQGNPVALNQRCQVEQKRDTPQAELIKSLREELDAVQSKYAEALHAKTDMEQESRTLVAAMEKTKADRDALSDRLRNENMALTSEIVLLQEERRNHNACYVELEAHVVYLTGQLDIVKGKRHERSASKGVDASGLGSSRENSDGSSNALSLQAPLPYKVSLRSCSPEEQSRTFYMVEEMSPKEPARGRKRRRRTSNSSSRSRSGSAYDNYGRLVRRRSRSGSSIRSRHGDDEHNLHGSPKSLNAISLVDERLATDANSPRIQQRASSDHRQDKLDPPLIVRPDVPPPKSLPRRPPVKEKQQRTAVEPNAPSLTTQPSAEVAATKPTKPPKSLPSIDPSWIPDCAHVSAVDGKWRAGEDKEIALRNEALGLPPPSDVLIETGFPNNVREVRYQVAIAQKKGRVREVAYINSWFEATKKVPADQLTYWMKHLQDHWKKPDWIMEAQPLVLSSAVSQAAGTQVIRSHEVDYRNAATQVPEAPEAQDIRIQWPVLGGVRAEAPIRPGWDAPIEEWAQYFLDSPKAVETSPGISQETSITQVQLRNVRGFILVGSRAPGVYTRKGGAPDAVVRWFRACAELIAFPGRYASLVQSGLTIASERKQVAARCPAYPSFGYMDAARALAEQGVTIEEIDDAQPFGPCWIACYRYPNAQRDFVRGLRNALTRIPEEAITSLPCFEPQVYPLPGLNTA